MMTYVILCYVLALILMLVIMTVQGYMKRIDWAVVLLAPVTIPTFIIHYCYHQLKNK
jgi:hypothetical protein